MRLAAALVFFAIGCSTTTARAADTFPPCRASFEHLFADRVFDSYPVSIPKYRPVRPDLRSGRAHSYRTVIAMDAKGGANFAGHYTISFAGCGIRTSCIAIIDQRTGRVLFPPEMREASALYVDLGARDYKSLYFKRGSNLLVLAGSANEDARHEGVSYYLWKNDTLHLIRRIPIGQLCRWPGTSAR